MFVVQIDQTFPCDSTLVFKFVVLLRVLVQLTLFIPDRSESFLGGLDVLLKLLK